MQRNTILAGCITGLALLGGSVAAQRSPAVFAATPHLAVTAAHQWITVQGSNFSTSGRPVSLDTYGLAGGGKIFLTSATVTPLTKSPHLSPCLLGVLCYAGGFSVTSMRQTHDPCVRYGFSRIEVDAWTTGPLGKIYEAASARATVTCPPPFVG